MASPDTPRSSRAKRGTRRKQHEDALARLKPLGARLKPLGARLKPLGARLKPLGARLQTRLRWVQARLQWLRGPLAGLYSRVAPLLPPVLRQPRRAALAGSGLALTFGVALVLVFTVGGAGSHSAASSSASGHAAGGKTASKLLGGDHRALPPGAKESTVGGAATLARSAGALPLPTRLTGRAVAWRAGEGGTLLAAVSREYGSATQAGGMRQYASMRYNCGLLASSVSAAQTGPPIPVPAMQKLYARALAELATAAAHCKAAISQQPDGDESIETHEDPSLFRLATSELTTGARDLYRATAEIQAARLRHH
jgi:hypothetical protein